MPNKQAYQISTGEPRRVYGARDRIRQDAHTLVIQTTDGETAKGQPNALWATDLRRGRLNIYGGLLRFIDHLARRGIPLETALMIPQWIESYIHEVYGDTPSERAEVVKIRLSA